MSSPGDWRNTVETERRTKTNYMITNGSEMLLSSCVLGWLAAQGKSLESHVIIRQGWRKISDSKEKSPLCQQPHAARMMKRSKPREEVTEMERDEEKRKDNNTYTGYGDDLDLVTLDKTNRGRERESD